MPISTEFTAPNIYIFHWSGIVRPTDALDAQEAAIEHAAAHAIERQIQVVDMRDLQFVAWNVDAFRDVVSLNQNVQAMYVVRPPRYLKMGAHALQPFVRHMSLHIYQDYDRALMAARTEAEAPYGETVPLHP